jgi:hypothetical protein
MRCAATFDRTRAPHARVFREVELMDKTRLRHITTFLHDLVRDVRAGALDEVLAGHR